LCHKEQSKESDDSEVKLEIVKFFREKGTPTDEEVHALAEKLGIEKHKFEGIIYSLLADKLNKSANPFGTVLKPAGTTRNTDPTINRPTKNQIKNLPQDQGLN
jgi:hypothetical protein